MPPVTTSRIRFTTHEFERMVEADVFGTNRVELLNGRVYRMTQNETHMWAVSKGFKHLSKIAPDDEWIATQGTLKLNLYSMPDPDLLWLPCPMGTPRHRWPAPLLLIEISDTTYKKDSGVKLRNYAAHGIAEYWIENLREKRIEVYRSPLNPTGDSDDCSYDDIRHYVNGESIALLGRPGVTIAVDDMLP